MKTATGQDCGGKHGKGFLRNQFGIQEINGRRYTVCSHVVGNTICGELIDVTDGPIVFCCGRHHDGTPALGRRTH